jgi:hypothetical protein
MANHLLVSKYSPDGHLYYACIAGLVVSYCRPFTSAQGLRQLPAEFEQFKNVKNPELLAQIHADLFVARDKIIAHFDLEYGEGEFHEKRYVLHPGEVELRLRVDGFDIRTNFTTLPPGRISEVNQLLAFQIERIEQCQTDFAISVLKETKGKIGSYIFIPAKKKSS